MQDQMKRIRKFYSKQHIALVGYSREPQSFSQAVRKEMEAAGLTVSGINPGLPDGFGERCYRRLCDVAPLPEAALILVAPENMGAAFEECKNSGLKLVWMGALGGKKRIPGEIIADAERSGIELIVNHCPLMFLEGGSRFHRFHGWIWKLIGKYPK